MAEGEGGAGYSGPIAERGSKVLASLDKGAPKVPFEQKWAWPPEGAPHASPNHITGALNTELARAAAAGDVEQVTKAAGVLRRGYWPREKARLWSHETLACDNHTHQHLNGVSMGRVGAVVAASIPGLPIAVAEELLDETLENMRTNAAALRAVATPFPKLYVGSAGTRCPGDPLFFAGTTWLRVFYGAEQDYGAEFLKRPQQWEDPYSNGPRALRYLQARVLTSNGHSQNPAARDAWLDDVIRSRGGRVPAAGCNMKFDVTVYRLEGVEHLVVLSEPKGERRDSERDVCSWFRAPHTARDFRSFMAGSKWGKNWETPPPAPRKGSIEIHFPASDPYVLAPEPHPGKGPR